MNRARASSLFAFLALACGCTSTSAPGGAHASASPVAISDAAGNTIVSKTYNATTAPPAASVYDSLGTLDSTHRVLTGNEVVRIAVTQGATANMPAFLVVFEWLPIKE